MEKTLEILVCLQKLKNKVIVFIPIISYDSKNMLNSMRKRVVMKNKLKRIRDGESLIAFS